MSLVQPNIRSSNDAGFTLIEALVAMVVLALGAVSLLAATEGHTARITAITDRTTARWVAENRLTELRLGLAQVSDTDQMLGQNWRISTTLTPTTDPALRRATVAVGRAAGDSGSLVSLTGYVTTAGPP